MYTYEIFNDTLEFKNIINDFFKITPYRVKRAEFPYIDLYEDRDELEIRTILPGISNKDLNIYLDDNSLIIEGEKKSDYTDNPYIRKERLFGKFKKSVKLPFKVNNDNVQAKLKDGILLVKLTKSEDAKPKKIILQ